MEEFRILTDDNGNSYVEVPTRGYNLLNNPMLNKGTAFPENEREIFGLRGFLPPHISTIEEQIERVYENYRRKDTMIERYIHLRALQDRNETLFYAVLLKHIDEMIPIVYTPTVAQACREFSHIFRRSRGLYISPKNIKYINAICKDLSTRKVEIIVVTDGEAILGIGDQGIGGMGIPIGKLSLYVAGAGIYPLHCLPIILDVGTNNEELLNDPLYLGLKHERLRGDDYLKFIDAFVEGIRRNFPSAILQWEDFSKQNASSILDRYRERIISFNDDIQGTGAMVLAGTLCALRISNQNLIDQTFAIYGAGAAGMGIARQIYAALRQRGMSEQEAKDRIYALDSKGLIISDRPGLERYKRQFARNPHILAEWRLPEAARVGLLDVIKHAKPTVLCGTSAQRGAFSEDVVKGMLDYVDRPIIFPLSNPNSNIEALPGDICRWTQGRAIIATGSPFEDVVCQGKRCKIGQGNNVFIFPGVGLGTLISGARMITDEMFTAAAHALCDCVPEEYLRQDCVYPEMHDLREVSKCVAVAVAMEAFNSGLATKVAPDDLEGEVEQQMWVPQYMPYRPELKSDYAGHRCIGTLI